MMEDRVRRTESATLGLLKLDMIAMLVTTLHCANSTHLQSTTLHGRNFLNMQFEKLKWCQSFNFLAIEPFQNGAKQLVIYIF